ncbi:MAG: phenylacetate--CoA ligase family protein [Casimicrobiaceae bacterium]
MASTTGDGPRPAPGSLPSRLRWASHFAWHLRGQARLPFQPLEFVQRRQAERVRQMVSYAFRTVPYYRETFRRLGLGPADFQGGADLARLPVLEREQIQRDPEYFCSETPARSDLLRITSGGSCGAPRAVLHDPRGVFENAAHGERERSIWTAIIGRSTGYRELVIAPPHSTTLKVQRYCRERGLYPRRVGIEREYASLLDPPQMTLAHINAFRPHVVHSYGSHLAILFGHLVHTGEAMHRPDVVTYTSDSLSPSVRALIEQRFGIPVFTTYQAVEAFKIGFDCELHSGVHLNIDLYPLRVVDGAGHDLPPADSGEVIVSNLVNRGMVLLNYRLGDIVALLPDRCPCGRSLPLLSYPQGRSDDLIELPSGRIVHPQAIRSLFNEEGLIWEYQVEHLTATHFRVALLAAPACDRQATRQRVAANLMQLLGPVALDIEFVAAIDRTVGGKFAPVISRLARARRAAA